MLKNTRLQRWMLAVATLAALSGAAVHARQGNCPACYPCASDSNGGIILCCDREGC